MSRRVAGIASLALCTAMLVVAPAALAEQTARDTANAILHEPAYRYCRDPMRIVRPYEMRYCGYIDARSACPEFARACEMMSRRPASCAPQNIGAYSTAARTLLLLIAIVSAVTLLSILLRAMFRARRTEALVDRRARIEANVGGIAIPAASSAELLARAVEARSRGDHLAALYALYGALLRRLDERGVIRLDPVHTNGDYVRQCAANPVRDTVRETVLEVERVRFGGADAREETIDRLLSRIEPVVRALGVLVIAFAVAGAVSACGGSSRRSGEGWTDNSPAGHRAVRELLNRQNIRARRLAEAPENVQDISRVVVIDGTAVQLEPEQWTDVLAWVERGGALVIAGGATGWPRELGVTTESRGTAEPFVGLNEALGGTTATMQPGTPALARGPTGFVIAAYRKDDAPYATRIERGTGRMLVMAGADLVTNAGMAVGDNPIATVALFRQFAEGREVYFVEDAQGGPSSPLAAMARAGLLPLVLQGLLALALFYLMVGRHFGTPRDRTLVSRRAFAEHVRAVGHLYARSRASRAALRAYGALALERFRERTGGHRGSLADAVAARVGAPLEEVEAVLTAVERAQGEEDIASKETQDLAVIKSLNQWLRKLS